MYIITFQPTRGVGEKHKKDAFIFYDETFTLQKFYLGKNINLKNFGEKICICFFKRKRSLYKDFTLDKDMKCKEFEVLSKLNKILLKYLFLFRDN